MDLEDGEEEAESRPLAQWEWAPESTAGLDWDKNEEDHLVLATDETLWLATLSIFIFFSQFWFSSKLRLMSKYEMGTGNSTMHHVKFFKD